MKIFFDESRNTGEIGHKNGKLNYYEQRYFVLVGYIANKNTTNEYSNFFKRNIDKIKSNQLLKDEIKGSDLMRKDNNEILKEFLELFMVRDHFCVSIYDKKYFLVSQMLIWILGDIFRAKYFTQFYAFAEILHKLNDIVLINYLEVTKHNNKENIVVFLNYLLKYDYKECVTIAFEADLIQAWREAIIGFMSQGNKYIDLLLDNNVENLYIYGSNRNNIVNLTALGELILLLKFNDDQLDNKDIMIYHDKIEVVQDYINHYLKFLDIAFVDSKETIEVQISDNASSVIGGVINKLLPLNNDKDIIKLLGGSLDWQIKIYRTIFSSLDLHNVKMVTSLREQAFLKTVLDNKYGSLFEFKKEILKNLDIRFQNEYVNHQNLNSAYHMIFF